MARNNLPISAGHEVPRQSGDAWIAVTAFGALSALQSPQPSPSRPLRPLRSSVQVWFFLWVRTARQRGTYRSPVEERRRGLPGKIRTEVRKGRKVKNPVLHSPLDSPLSNEALRHLCSANSRSRLRHPRTSRPTPGSCFAPFRQCFKMERPGGSGTAYAVR